MDIALCFDKNIGDYAAVLLTSICETNRGEMICFHIVQDGSLLKKQISIMEKLAHKYEQNICFYTFDIEQHDLPITDYHASTFMRIFLPEIISDKIEKILYLDIDMIVLGNLRELFSIKMEGNAFLVCIDDCEYSTKTFNRIDLPFTEWKGKSYFNTGMMLIDLDCWRKENLTQNVLLFMREHQNKKYRLADQDVLNVIFHDRAKIISSKYNYLLNLMLDYRNFDIRQEQYSMIQAASTCPRIVHRYGYEHPWYSDSKNPYTKIWRYFAKLAGINDYHRCFTGKNLLRNTIRNYLAAFGLCMPFDLQYSEQSIRSAKQIYQKIIKKAK